MTEKEDLCPSTDNGNHRYFIFKVVEVFEPYKFTPINVIVNDEEIDVWDHVENIPTIYEKVEYAISGCNCGSSIKQKVKQL